MPNKSMDNYRRSAEMSCLAFGKKEEDEKMEVLKIGKAPFTTSLAEGGMRKVADMEHRAIAENLKNRANALLQQQCKLANTDSNVSAPAATAIRHPVAIDITHATQQEFEGAMSRAGSADLLILIHHTIVDANLVYQSKIKDLQPLRRLGGKGLVGLYIPYPFTTSGGVVEFAEVDLSPVQHLTDLAQFMMPMCAKDIGPLSKLNGLFYLDLSNSEKLTDISPLAPLKNLANVDLDGCKALRDKSILKQLANIGKARVPSPDELSRKQKGASSGSKTASQNEDPGETAAGCSFGLVTLVLLICVWWKPLGHLSFWVKILLSLVSLVGAGFAGGAALSIANKREKKKKGNKGKKA
jgi:hypothetical protein